MPADRSVARHRARSWLILVLVVAAMSACGESDIDGEPTPMRGGGVAIPAIEGPVTGGNGAPFLASTMIDLAQVGYRSDEYFISGTATAYESEAPLTADGMWTAVQPGTSAAYKTRILVYRPIDRRDFNGT